MPVPRRVGQWNKTGLNRLTRHIAPWLPGFGVVVHFMTLTAAATGNPGTESQKAS
jgi:hypothetical protein